MKKLILLFILAACSSPSTSESIKPDTAKVEQPAAEAANDVAHGWYVEKRITVEGNYVTRINDHETGVVCYLANRFAGGSGHAYSSDSVAAAIYCFSANQLNK